MVSPNVRRAVALILAAAALNGVAAGRASAADLPIPCVAGSCAGVSRFVESGQASATVTGNTLRINQTTDKVALNWASFNVSADGRVVFQQPGAGSIALNRIYQDSPSRIFGALEANGQVYLVNPNGVVFGSTSHVSTSGLLASTLNISAEVFEKGLLSPDLLARHVAALESDGRIGVLGADGKPLVGDDGKPVEIQLTVEAGAQIKTTGVGGRILLASRKVDNAGKLEAPDGQVLIAAGEKVYLQASTDPGLRGLLVEVDQGGEAWNRLTGDISAARGNVTVAGLAVNQQGRISATTTVNANGSIRLQARDTVTFNGSTPIATRGGTAELGAKSVTTVLPELDDLTTALPEQVQSPSSVDISAQQVVLKSGSKIVVPGGSVSISARKNPSERIPAAADPASRIRMESGAIIDVSGGTATVSAARNLVSVELRANELADSPVQRDGFLRGKTVVVDASIGTPLANVEGAINAIPKTIAEYTSKGGTVVFDSQGDVVTANDARIDVSGGKINYEGAPVQTTLLIGADGKVVDIGQADPNKQYIGLVNPTSTRSYQRWGVKETVAGPNVSRYETGYTNGQAAGTLQFIAPNMVLNGTFTGYAVAGDRQRFAGTVPAGGKFIIGLLPDSSAFNPLISDYRAPSVTFVTAPPNIVVDSGAQLPGPRTLELPTTFLTSGGFQSTTIDSNGVVTLPESMPLNLSAGSSLTLRGYRVNLNSDITAPSGSIKVAAGAVATVPGVSSVPAGLFVGEGVTLDVSGVWTNDTFSATAPVFRDAGTIDLSASSFTATDASATAVASELSIGSNTLFRANAGAWLQEDGTLVAGNAGSIMFRSQKLDSAFSLGDDVGLEAYAVQGGKGGTFALEAGRVEIVHDAVWATQQRFDPKPPKKAPGDVEDVEGEPGDPERAPLRIGDSLFSDHGFTHFTITASAPAASKDQPDVLTVTSGSNVNARANVLQLTGVLATRASGGGVSGFSQLLVPFESDREAASIALLANPYALPGRVTVEAGAVIQGAAGSQISFASQGSIRLAGQIAASGGTISATINTPSEVFDTGFNPALSIELASTGLLDVSGSALLVPNDANLRLGEVLDGGTVTLRANRGSVLLAPGSRIDVSGTSAALDLPAPQSASGYSREIVGSAGGAINLLAAESIALSGEIAAHAGAAGKRPVPGGSLSVQLTRENVVPGVLSSTYPNAPRTIRITPTAFAAGGSPPNGLALVSVANIEQSGIDALRLGTDQTGRIEFESGVNLALGRELILDSPALDLVSSDTVKLSAPHIALGFSKVPPSTPLTPTSGAGKLELQGDLIDLVGTTTLLRTGSATFSSSADMRMIGYSGTGIGSLSIAGDLTLQATRIYPTTLTDFSVKLSGKDGGVLRIAPAGASPGAPLSAGGVMRLSAGVIEQGGTLLAPFGTIVLNATQSVRLFDDSVTSVSADDTLIPFGRVELGEWLSGRTAESLTSRSEIPDRTVSITAPQITFAPKATLDLRGGGDLYAYSWVPGTGGTKDALAPDVTPGLYAVLPDLIGQYAPYDSLQYAGSDLQVGASVYLSGTAGLPAGVYPLLPARYALLPGAYLVHAVAGYEDIQPGTTATLPDASTIVAGYRTFGQTGLGDARYSGFSVSAGSYGRELATYDDFFASSFYPDAATRLDLGRVPIPADAGTLTLNAQRTLSIGGNVLTDAAKGGRGAIVDISAPRLEVTNGEGPPTVGIVQIDADVLERWNPASVLLGGVRSSTEDGIRIDTTADSVSFLDGVQLDLNELLVTAKSKVSVDSGAQLSTRSATSPTKLQEQTLEVSGGAAVLALSDASRFSVDRTNGAGSTGGQVVVSAGSRVASHGSLLFDMPAGGALEGQLDGSGAAWDLNSSHITFADEPASDGLTITRGLLARVGQGSAVRFASAGAIDFLTSVEIGTGRAASSLDSIALSAATLRALDPAVQVNLAAKSIDLGGVTSGSNTGPLAAGTASLSLTGQEVHVLPGALAIEGFGSTLLRSQGLLAAEGAGTVRTSGSLELASARLTTATGAHASFSSEGALSVTRTGADPGTAGVPMLGGDLTLSGDSVQVSGNIVLPSGLLTVNAASRLDVLSGAVLDVSGTTVTAGGRSVGTPGGAISLVGTDVHADSGSIMRVSGAQGSNAGLLAIEATGTADIRSLLAGTADADQQGASLRLFAGSLTDFSGLNSLLQAGGFTEERSVHVVDGDLTLGAGETIAARNVELTTDTGSIRIAGTITSHSQDTQRGAINLFAGQDVELQSGGVLRADGTGELGRGGTVTLGSTSGVVSLGAGSLIDTRGTHENGSVLLRARALEIEHDVAIGSVASTLTGVGTLTVEPVIVVNDAPAVLDSFTLDGYLAQAGDYAAQAIPLIGGRLGLPAGTTLSIQPGIELRRDGDLQIGDGFSNIDLSSYRFSGEPAALTFRASGSITVNGVLTDGFMMNPFTGTADLLDGRSSTLRFAAGASLSSANPLSIQRGAAADLSLVDAVVRTGTGDIQMAAARDIVFSTSFPEGKSSVYTGGLPVEPEEFPIFGYLVSNATQGGDVFLNAGRDVVGNGVIQSVATWQTRDTPFDETSPSRWGVDIDQFRWNAGTFGGGDLTVRAGRDVREIAAAAADGGIQHTLGGPVTELAGGVLSIDAGRDITSSMLHVAAGINRVHAGGELGRSRQAADGARLLGSLISMQDARLDISAVAGIAIESVFNPTVLRTAQVDYHSDFLTYGPTSALNLQSVTGDISLTPNAQAVARNFMGPGEDAANGDGSLLGVLPANVSLQSLSRDVLLSGSGLSMFGSDSGQLDIFAGRDISVGLQLSMSDAPASQLAGPDAAQPTQDSIVEALALKAGSARHALDTQPALISAGRDITSTSAGALNIAKATRITADRDIIDLSLKAQNVRGDDQTLIAAGRDFRYTRAATLGRAIELGGYGRLDVIAGRDIDFGFSDGITTTGGLTNVSLNRGHGADVTVMAGLGQALNAAAFIDKVVSPSTDYRAALIRFVSGSATGMSFADALAAFLAMSADQQRPFLTDTFFKELVIAGREANTDPSTNFARGYAAVDNLFPGSRCTDDAGCDGTSSPKSPYAGNVNLTFSRIYTLDGGNISLLVPGGGVDVGLAVRPSVGNVPNKQPSQLGIVAQGAGDVRIFTNDDVLVNSSRVFTLGGGDIAIWSTTGDIDAGRGAKTAISAPAPTVTVSPTGLVSVNFGGAVAGSGIRAIRTTPEVKAGNVDLIAPKGIVNAGDAGIGAAGNLNVAAQQVVGLDNIQVGGSSTGVPAETSNLGASLSGVSSVANSATNSATSSLAQAESGSTPAPLADSALGWLDVFVEGFGEDVCKANDTECLQRNRKE